MSASGIAGTPVASALAEIRHLLDYLESSSCKFYRNGTWHDAKDARAHLEQKNEYLMKRSLISSAEDFIEKAATSSSMSGERYLVRCQPNRTVPSSVWLSKELERLRSAQRVAR